ncbi:MAG: hypothetical protein PVI90_03920 [Desulfobacteraceae bacterium]|jgi:hypothetical protein
MEEKSEKNIHKKKKLKIKELEKKILPSVLTGKKPPYYPDDPPYAPGTDYGLVKRDNLLKFN